MDLPPDIFHFHHIGVACRQIDSEQRGWMSLGYTPDSERFEDPLQGVSGVFMSGPGPRMELLENLPGSDTLNPFLDAGIKMYHNAFEVPELERAVTLLQNQRARILSPPKPAVALEGAGWCL